MNITQKHTYPTATKQKAQGMSNKAAQKNNKNVAMAEALRLLERLQKSSHGNNRPDRPKLRSQPQQTQAVRGYSTPPNRPKHQVPALRRVQWMAASGVGIGVLALFLAGLSNLVLDKKFSHLHERVGSAAKDQAELRFLVEDGLHDHGKKLIELQRQIGELKNPPLIFQEAQNLFAAGKYADAEAAYGRLLTENPSSRISDVVLNNSALANAMQGKCSMVTSRFAEIRARFPSSTLLQNEKNVLLGCDKNRKAAGSAQ